MSETLSGTGVTLSKKIRHGGVVMALTTIPYFLIQVPASFLHGTTEDIAKGEHWWSLSALVLCVIGLISYMYMQLKFSDAGQDRDKRIAIAKKTLREGKMSLKGVLKSAIQNMESKRMTRAEHSEYGSMASTKNGSDSPPKEILDVLKELLYDAFCVYDADKSGKLEKSEIRVFLKDFHEYISDEEINRIQSKVDMNNDSLISLDEFVILCYYLIMSDENKEMKNPVINQSFSESVAAHVFSNDDNDEGEEVEDLPEEFTDLSPEEQQTAIKLRAFKILFIGTLMVVYFSDPMVDVMQEIAVKANIPTFYVSFVLAPLASNSSEVVASMFYAAKKTRKTMTVSLSALEGAACMNNTFCLCIFMGLIYARGLAWQYTAETSAIVVVQFIMAFLVQKNVMTTGTAVGVLMIFPLSLVFVFAMEYFGFD
jgi:Ca2+/Na+ antiporter